MRNVSISAGRQVFCFLPGRRMTSNMILCQAGGEAQTRKPPAFGRSWLITP